MNALVEILDENQFEEVLKADLPVLVDFWAPWCNPCKDMMSIVSAVAKQYAEKVIFVKVNIDNLSAIASRYSVGSIPHCILFQGGVSLGVIRGLQSQKALMDFLKQHLPT
jgi:thioredoxin 1